MKSNKKYAMQRGPLIYGTCDLSDVYGVPGPGYLVKVLAVIVIALHRFKHLRGLSFVVWQHA